MDLGLDTQINGDGIYSNLMNGVTKEPVISPISE
jgi:hypothetical protein